MLSNIGFNVQYTAQSLDDSVSGSEVWNLSKVICAHKGQVQKTITHPFLVEEGAPSGHPVVVVGAKEVHTKHALLVRKVLYVVWDEARVQDLARPPSAGNIYSIP